MAHKNYPELYRSVAGRLGRIAEDIPEPFDGFRKLHVSSVADGALSTKHKELIALAIGLAVRCDGCIAFHVHDALKAGATREEILETLGVVILMGGGPSAVYAGEALEALDQFEAEERDRASPAAAG
ncbi:MAG: carboxymuconolactone decarboxylase family protein [Gemmatimonadetes bacterium]|nr:carboxymuconolactone decarboxylase family protein [Gemmatimonadota bacterium]